MDQFKNMLNEHDLKATHQRLSILDEIHKSGHIDIESLLLKLKTTFPTMSHGTLYRNINDLHDIGILTEVQIPHHKQRYEITKEKHIHLFCENCKEIEDFMVSTDKLVEYAEAKSGYRITKNSIILSGICKNCRENSAG